jgi:hypothetical protein
MDERLKTNLAKWNAVVPVHARSKMYDVATSRQDEYPCMSWRTRRSAKCAASRCFICNVTSASIPCHGRGSARRSLRRDGQPISPALANPLPTLISYRRPLRLNASLGSRRPSWSDCRSITTPYGFVSRLPPARNGCAAFYQHEWRSTAGRFSDGITISQLERSRIHNCVQRLLKGAGFITEFQPFWIFPSTVLAAHASSGRQLSGQIMEQ